VVEHLLRQAGWDRRRIRQSGESLRKRPPPETKSSLPYLSFLHPLFPERLNQLFDPPCGLYGRGSWKLLRHRGPWIGVVGTRAASPHALQACRELVEGFLPYRAMVISGMARGIDAKAHETALRLGLPTIGLLGTPVDRVYPRENLPLFRRMAEEGLLLSELPPHAEMGKWRFPERNRLIAALAEALVVVEASKQSGALSTARFALELGREIFIVPGPMDERNLGGHRLIQDGAHLLTQPEEIFRILGYPKRLSRAESSRRRLESQENFSPEEKKILAVLAAGSAHIDKILSLCHLPAPLATAQLTALTMKGILNELPGKLFEIK
jgi:DNA processing protein